MRQKNSIIILLLLAITLGMLWYVKFGDRAHSVKVVQSLKVETAKSQEQPILTPPSNADSKPPTVSAPLIPPVTLTFLDIGQGDATFIEWPDGTQMLVDCAKDARVLEALGRVMKFYDKEIDYMVVTHPDMDHYGGCTDVLKRFDIKKIIWTGYTVPDSPWQYFLDTVNRESAIVEQIVREETRQIGNSNLSFLYPDHDVSADAVVPGTNKIGDNNTSIVIKLSYGRSDVLLTGDAEAPLEEYLISKYGQGIDVEVLKVGHHGSNSSSIQPFIAAVAPDHAVISAGKENDYGHPTLRVLRRLERAGAKVWRTDEDGDIVAQIYQNKVLMNSATR